MLSRVVRRSEAACGKAYDIQSSSDAPTWTTVHQASDANGGVDDVDLSATGRYVRKYGTSRARRYRYSLWEVEIYGTPATTAGCDQDSNATLRRPATASSVEGGVFVAANAVDGNANSRWSSDFSDPQWIQVDMGATTTVCRVELSWGNAYGRAYQLQLSADGRTLKLDGTAVFVASKQPVESTRGRWVYDHPFYHIVNLAVGADFPDPVDATTPFPARMLVDYVRVCQ